MSTNARAWIAGTIAVVAWIGGWDIGGWVTGDRAYFVEPELIVLGAAIFAWLMLRVLSWIERGEDEQLTEIGRRAEAPPPGPWRLSDERAVRALRDARGEIAGWQAQDERNLAEIVALGDRIEAATVVARRWVDDHDGFAAVLEALAVSTGDEETTHG